MGHLFVVRGDLTRLHCDAWLLPTDRQLTFTSGWLKCLPPPPREWNWEGRRCQPWPDWPGPGPQPWPTIVGAHNRTAQWFVDGALEFVAAAGARLAGHPSRSNRPRPLLALPLVGTGQGGAFFDKGAISSLLVPSLREFVAEQPLDVALVTAGEAAFAACQFERRRVEDWSELTQPERERARDLARVARAGHLAFFLGAGVSMGAGLPSWTQLLKELLKDSGLSARTVRAVQKMSHLDQAQLLAKRNRLELRQRVAAKMRKGTHCALAHCLLAGIPHREAVTQNYDCLYEQASTAAGLPPSVLPYSPIPGRRWLLKMHGCVTHPEDIVLSREDFLRYSKSRGALAGLVQGLLLTRHLVFVGFSLTDENFLAIMDEVRRARGNFSEEKLGTALLLKVDDPWRELWEDDLDLVDLGDSRRFEIFLDCLLSETADCSRHLLDPTYDRSLTHPERWLKERLLTLALEAGPGVRQTSAWQAVQTMLSELGGFLNEG